MKKNTIIHQKKNDIQKSLLKKEEKFLELKIMRIELSGLPLQDLQ